MAMGDRMAMRSLCEAGVLWHSIIITAKIQLLTCMLLLEWVAVQYGDRGAVPQDAGWSSHQTNHVVVQFKTAVKLRGIFPPHNTVDSLNRHSMEECEHGENY